MTESTDDTTEANAESDPDREERTSDYLDNVDDGSGCTEIWAHLSQQRKDE